MFTVLTLYENSKTYKIFSKKNSYFCQRLISETLLFNKYKCHCQCSCKKHKI